MVAHQPPIEYVHHVLFVPWGNASREVARDQQTPSAKLALLVHRVNGVMPIYNPLVVVLEVAREWFRKIKGNGSATLVELALPNSTELADVREMLIPPVVLVCHADLGSLEAVAAAVPPIRCVPRAHLVQLGSLKAVAAAVLPIHSVKTAQREDLPLVRSAQAATVF